MKLTPEQQAVLDGSKGAVMAKVMAPMRKTSATRREIRLVLMHFLLFLRRRLLCGRHLPRF